MKKTLLCFGLGYSAQALAKHLLPQHWSIVGTTRDAARAQALQSAGIEMHALDALPVDIWKRVTHVLHSIPPGNVDEVLTHYKSNILAAPGLEWLGYLSTTGVYGDHGGGWVDERTPAAPVSVRQKRRAQTEAAFLSLYKTHGVPAHIFRLAGIYGPGRSVVEDVRDGSARRIYKEGQVFSRIHVEDIAQTLLASINRPAAGEIYNVCDDEPAPAHEVIAYACAKLDMQAPPIIPVEEANLSEMGREFYSSNRRVSNRKIRENLGVQLRYPSYREGVDALIASL